MATLIRLKQLESGSTLQAAAAVGEDFTGSVYEVIDAAGLFSSSAQVLLVSASGYNELATDLEVAAISASITATSLTFVTTASFNSYTASLGDTFATDEELFLTSSLMDAGEF